MGENLAWGPGQDFAGIVAMWYNEVAQYVPGSGFSMATGHFTQLVWRDTSRVGCAMNTACPGAMSTMYACHYNPAGKMNELGHLMCKLAEKKRPMSPW